MKDWRETFRWKGITRWRFTGNFEKNTYLGAKITHAKENARRRRQIERGYLKRENGLTLPPETDR